MKKILLVNFLAFLEKTISRYKRVFLDNLSSFSRTDAMRVCKERIVNKSGKLSITPVVSFLKSWPFPKMGVFE